ncbi:MAG: hypothetical protein K0R75_394 [Paenibacillaceae bacterium]|nr:hypothetical protein [Paenibacillaceae bacterium]
MSGGEWDMEQRNNVVLLPGTVDYYQIELTKMLEEERYGEAVELLAFLLQCRPVDSQTEEEWRTLSEWLKNSFSVGSPVEFGKRSPSSNESEQFSDEDEEELTEGRLVRLRWQSKAGRDLGFVRQLLDSLKRAEAMAEQIEAIEQLSQIDNPDIAGELIEWLGSTVVHPLVMFKGLQALKGKGMTGEFAVPKRSGAVVVRIEDTPVSREDYPPPIAEIWCRLADESVHDGAEIAEFAKVMLQEFIAFIYTTPIYKQLVELNQEETEAWAAALHTTVMDLLPPSESSGASTLAERYGIAGESDRRTFEQALTYIRRFTSQVYRLPPLS